MLFNSYEFIFIFLPITLAIYYYLCLYRVKLTYSFLALASIVFYSYWDYNNLLILIPSIIFNYLFASIIQNNKSKVILSLSIACNILAISIFKYFNFLIDIANIILSTNIDHYNINLPLGISFFTFTQIACIVDIYRRKTNICTFDKYALFVTIFPHLIAGPILDYKNISQQFNNFKFNRKIYKNISIGFLYFSIGLFKKVVLADSLSEYVSISFSSPSELTILESWFSALAYTAQLFLDFSAYSDMAIGLGWMLGYDLPINFRTPYLACSIGDFWRRWHISLSTFFKNYLYIPLGGSRRSQIRTYFNVFIVMMLCGLWHGAGFQFLIWGMMHGTFLIIQRIWTNFNFRLPKVISWMITMFCVVIAWVVFRAENINDALIMINSMFDVSSLSFPAGGRCERLFAFLPPDIVSFKSNLFNFPHIVNFPWFSPLILAFLFIDTQSLVNKFKPNITWTIILAFFFIISIYSLNDVSEFLYFQF